MMILWRICEVWRDIILLFNRIIYVVFIYIYIYIYIYLYEKYRDLLEKYNILRDGVIFINRKSYDGWDRIR